MAEDKENLRPAENNANGPEKDPTLKDLAKDFDKTEAKQARPPGGRLGALKKRTGG